MSSQAEIDVGAFETDRMLKSAVVEEPGGVATAVWAPLEPTVAVETILPDFDEYEVRVFDARRGRRLGATEPIEMSQHQHLAFNGIWLSIVD